MTEETIISNAVDTADAAPAAPAVEVVADAVPAVAPVTSILTPPADLVAPVIPELVVDNDNAAAPVVESVVEVPIEPPVYEPFVFPENAVVDDAVVGDFTKTIAEFEITTKADHAEVQKFAQSLVDRHVTLMNNFREAQAKAVETERQSWVEDFKKDPEFGGNREMATIEGAQKFIRTHGGTVEQQKELYDILARTGLDNHKAIIRTFARAAMSPSLSEGAPKAAPQVPASISLTERLYGKV